MFIQSFKVQCVSIFLGAVFLCQCTKAVNPPPQLTLHEKIANPYIVATESQDNNATLLHKAGHAITKGQWQSGLAILAQTTELSASQIQEKNLLLAEVAMQRGLSKAALDHLAQVKLTAVPSLYHQVLYHELLAKAYEKEANPLASVEQRIHLAPLLANAEEQQANTRALWLTLMNLPTEQLASTEASPGATLAGWVQLASIAHQYQGEAEPFLSALKQWQSQFSAHPANAMLPTPLESILPKIRNKPKRIALLLPLSGPLAGPGNAVKDGFMAAYQADPKGSDTPISLYDTDKNEVGSLYQQAIQEGADYVIGPLAKNQVATIAALPHPVPTLLLNEANLPLTDEAYSFGLSPSNEAIQVARKMHSSGLSRALIIAPADAWGDTVTKAFTDEWQKSHGVVVDALHYKTTENMTAPIRDLLQVDASLNRAKAMQHLVGPSLQTSASRRQDFDAIFLLAYPSKARQIMPLLQYYYAADVPVYATSSVYAGHADALKDKDLDGIRFCDLPFVFSHQMGSKNWPEQFNSYNRLYALGMDSYALTTRLNPLLLFPAFGSQETNGTLYLTPSQQVARVFEWGQFKQGLVHSIEGTA